METDVVKNSSWLPPLGLYGYQLSVFRWNENKILRKLQTHSIGIQSSVMQIIATVTAKNNFCFNLFFQQIFIECLLCALGHRNEGRHFCCPGSYNVAERKAAINKQSNFINFTCTIEKINEGNRLVAGEACWGIRSRLNLGFITGRWHEL